MSQADWPVESIPDEDLLYMRVHRTQVDHGAPMLGVFRNRGEGDAEGMSTDWSRYSTPQETRHRATSAVEENGVIRLTVGDVRQIPSQEVVHAPLTDNRAHTNVKGPKKLPGNKLETRLRFSQICQWAIPPPGRLKQPA